MLENLILSTRCHIHSSLLQLALLTSTKTEIVSTSAIIDKNIHKDLLIYSNF